MKLIDTIISAITKRQRYVLYERMMNDEPFKRMKVEDVFTIPVFTGNTTRYATIRYNKTKPQYHQIEIEES